MKSVSGATMNYGCSALDLFTASYFSLQWIIAVLLWRVHLSAECHSHLGTLDCFTSNQSACIPIFLSIHPSSHHPIEIWWKLCPLFTEEPFPGRCLVVAYDLLCIFYQYVWKEQSASIQIDQPPMSESELWQTHFFPESCPEVSSAT